MLARPVTHAHSIELSFAFGDVDDDGVADVQERMDGTDPYDAGSFRITCTVNLLPCGRSDWLTNYVAWGWSNSGWETNHLASFHSVTNYEFTVDGIATNGTLYAKVFRDLDTNGVYNAGVDALTVKRLLCADNGGRVDLRFGDHNGNVLPDWWEARTGLNAEGAARRAYDDPDGDGLINLHEYWMDTNPLAPDGSNTLLSVAARSIDDRINGIDPVTVIPRFLDYFENGPTNTFVANTNFWARDLDLSCVSVWHSGDNPGSKAATLITRRHVVMAEHWWNREGTYVFCDTNGNVCTRHLSQSQQISDDLRLGRLNEALPDSFKPAHVLSTNAVRYIASGKYLPTLCLNQVKKATVLELVELDAETTSIGGGHFYHYGHTSYTNLVSVQRCNLRATTVDGNSGCPVFLVAGDELVLLFSKHLGYQGVETWSPFRGPLLSFRLGAIQNKINEWEGVNASQYQIVPFDLSSFDEIINL